MAKITVIGIGHGGFAVAADMALAGHEVTMYVADRYRDRVSELIETKTITLSGCGRNGEAILEEVTSDPELAFKNDLIVPVIPATRQFEFAHEISEHIRPGHRIILIPGSTGGALVVAKILREKRKMQDVAISELHTLPYAARKTGPTEVQILLELRMLFFATFPAKYNDQIFPFVKDLYPVVQVKRDVLETSMNNGNPISHPAPIVLNAGRIEYAKGEYYHYREGITPSVARVLEKMESERQKICKALGYDIIHPKDKIYLTGYGPRKNSLYECYHESEVFNVLKGPKDLHDRYLTEDTPHSLVAWVSIAEELEIDTPVMNSIITLASALNDEDYWVTGRTVSQMGIDQMDIDELKEFLYDGYDSSEDMLPIKSNMD